MLKLIAIWLFSVVVSAAPSYITFPSDIDWVSRSSDHFDALFRRGQDAVAERALACAEKARALLSPIFPELPPRTWIVLADFNDNLNGYALDILYPHMVVFVAPPEPSHELASLDDWFGSVILHEFTHNTHLFPATGLWRPLRSIFGSIMAPMGLMPSHFHEGLAVLLETEMTRGGRGRSSYFSMLRRMAVHEKVWGNESFSIDQLDGSIFRWPFGTASYFMGYQLYQELWTRKKGEGVKQLVITASRTFPYFLEHPFTSTFDTDYAGLWTKIFEETRKIDEKEIARISQGPLSALQPISQTKFHKWDLHLSPTGDTAAFRSYQPETGSVIELWDLKKSQMKERIEEKVGGTEGMCFSPDGSELLLVVQSTFRGYLTHELKRYDLQKKSLEALIGDSPKNIVTMDCSADLNDVVVYREKSLEGELLQYQYNEKLHTLTKKRSWKNPPGTWVSGILAGQRSWVALRRAVQTDFYEWKEGEPKLVRTADGHFHGLRAFDGGSFLAVGQLEGRDEIWIVDPKKNTAQKHAAFLGGVSGFDLKQKQLVALNYRHGGYDLERVTPITAAPKTLGTAPTSSEMTPIVSSTMEYSPLGTLTPKTWIPLFLFVPYGTQIGFWIPGFDISQKHYYDIIAGYDTRGTAFGSLGYAHRFNQKKISSLLHYSPNYLNVGGELTLLARGGAGLALDTSIDDFTVQFGTHYSKLFDMRPGRIQLDSVGGSVTASYSFDGGRVTPLDVSPRSGTLISTSAYYYPTFLGSTQEYYIVTGKIDQYAPSPFKHHAFYLSLRGGVTYGTEIRNSFFEVGGEILFAPFRPSYFNRGFTPSRFAASEVINANLEYRFPIANIDRGYGLWPLKLRRIHAALVTDISTVDPSADHLVRDQLGKVYYLSSGLELKSDWIFSYYLPSQFRMGLYHGFGPVGEPLYFSVAVEASI